MEFLKVTARNLDHFLSSDLYVNSDFLIIPEIRARSMAKNPAMLPEDPLFIISHDQNKITGFIGFFPDKLQDGTQIFWNSGWWVSEGQGFQTSLQLFKMFVEACRHQIMITDTTLHTTQLMRAMPGFSAHTGRKAYRIFLQAPSAMKSVNVLKRKLIAGIGGMYSFILKTVIYKRSKKNATVRFEQTSPGNLNLDVLDACNKESAIHLSREKLQWIHENPWVTEDSVTDKRRYSFTYGVDDFWSEMIEIKSDSQVIGWCYITVVNGMLKVPYSYFQKEYAEDVANGILNQALAKKCHSIYLMNPFLVDAISRLLPFFSMKRKYEVPLFVSDNLSITKPILLQDGDGDAVFT